MKWIDYDISHELRYGDELIVNQNLRPVTGLNGEELDFVVKTGDEVIFQRQHYNDFMNKHLYFVVILKEDLYNKKRGYPCYGEFVLNNYQVDI